MRQALIAYYRRKRHMEDPEGRRRRDGRWLPTRSERQPCCKLVRPPTERKPDTLLQHCSTVEHVAHLHGVNPIRLRNVASEDHIEEELRRDGALS